MNGQTSKAFSRLVTLGLLLVGIRLVAALAWPVPLSVDEAQYWVWARDIQGGYYSKPPFIAMVLSLPLGICGPEVVEGCARVLQPLGFAVAAVAMGLLAFHFFRDRLASAWTALLVLSMPLVVFYSQVATTDAWLACWWSVSMYALARASVPSQGQPTHEQTAVGGLGWWLLLGAAVGMGLMTKYSMAAFAAPAAILVLARGQMFKPGAALALVTACMVVLPNILWNVEWGFPTFAHHADITLEQRTTPSVGRLLGFLALQALIFSPLVFWVGLGCLASRTARSPRSWGSTAAGFGLWMALPILALAALQALMGKANANWAAPAGLGLCLAMAAWALHPTGLQSRQSHGSLRATVALGLGVSVLFVALPWLVSPLGLDAQRKTNPLTPLVGYKDAALALRGSAPTPHIASGNRGLLAAIDAYWPDAEPMAWWPMAMGTPPHHWALQHRLHLSNPPPSTDEQFGWLVVESVSVDPQNTQALAQRLRAEAARAGFDVHTRPLAETHPVLAARLAQIALADRVGQSVEGVWVWPVKMPGIRPSSVLSP